MERAERNEPRIPSMTAREYWGGYAWGMAVETLFILALTGVGFLLAAVAAVIWL